MGRDVTCYVPSGRFAVPFRGVEKPSQGRLFGTVRVRAFTGLRAVTRAKTWPNHVVVVGMGPAMAKRQAGGWLQRMARAIGGSV
eukprot:2550676-Rhodomonas_salina.1